MSASPHQQSRGRSQLAFPEGPGNTTAPCPDSSSHWGWQALPGERSASTTKPSKEQLQGWLPEIPCASSKARYELPSPTWDPTLASYGISSSRPARRILKWLSAYRWQPPVAARTTYKTEPRTTMPRWAHCRVQMRFPKFDGSQAS